MYVHLTIYLRALRIALLRRPFRLRRWAIVALFSALFWSVWLFVSVGRLLDHVLFGGFRRQPIEEPTFVIAPPRSGTTFLQGLMALDEERFACVRLWESILPSVTWLRVVDGIAALDRRCGRPLARVIARVERRFFGGWDEVHRMSFTAPEEDECFFVYTLVAESVLLLFPYPRELWIATRADELPERARRRLMAHYASCLRRFLYVRGRGRTLLAKNPGTAGRIRAVLETFPDARIVSIVRHPYEVIPSHVSSFYTAWQVHSPDIAKVSDEVEVYAEVAVDWYRRMFENRDRPAPSRYALVRYDELVRAPQPTVDAVYAHFGWRATPTYAARLAEAASRARAHKSAHRYGLEEYGLSPSWVQERLGDVMDHYGLER